MAKLEMQIQINKTIKPSTPTTDDLRSLNLSLFDQLAPPIYVSLLLHYLPSRAENRERFTELQKSLADALAKFYPLAGRFNKDDFSVNCNDEGVEYVETKVNADLAEFLLPEDGRNRIVEQLNDLLPWRVHPNVDVPSSPLLGVQVNLFNCGGLVLGIQISHVLADAFTLGIFLKEWAHINLTMKTEHCFPSFGHLSSLFPTKVQLSEPDQLAPPSDIPPNTCPKIVTRIFVFDALAIKKLKDNIHSSSASRVVAVVSLIWKVLVGISLAKCGTDDSRDSLLLLVVNLRGKSNAPSCEHALGNFWMPGPITLEANKSRNHELNDFVDLVGSTIRDISVSLGKASNIDDTCSIFDKTKTEIADKVSRGIRDIYRCTSWCRFPWYEVDFGWGKPNWVSSVNHPVEVICLIDTKDGNGIEAWVSLKENDMSEFQKNLPILLSSLK